MILSGTGSRQLILLDGASRMSLIKDMISLITQLNPSSIISGGAEGFDEALAHAGFYLKIPVTLAIPSPTYGTYYWRDRSVTNANRYHDFNNMLAQAQEVVEVCDSHLWGKANIRRNEWMFDRADMVLSWAPKWHANGKPDSPGTRHGIDYCLRNGTPVTTLITATSH